MLYVPRPGAVRKVGVELRIAELAPKPRVVPKQKREQQQCQRQQRDQYMGAPAGTLVRLESFRWHARLIIHRVGGAKDVRISVVAARASHALKGKCHLPWKRRYLG